jgi:hypothetical protein
MSLQTPMALTMASWTKPKVWRSKAETMAQQWLVFAAAVACVPVVSAATPSAPSEAMREEIVAAILTCDEDTPSRVFTDAHDQALRRMRGDGWQPDRPQGTVVGTFNAFGTVFDELRGVEGYASLNPVGISRSGRVEPLLAALASRGLDLKPTKVDVGSRRSVDAWALTRTVGQWRQTITVLEGRVQEGDPGLIPGGVSLLCTLRSEGERHAHFALETPDPNLLRGRLPLPPLPVPKERPTQRQIEVVMTALLLCESNVDGSVKAPASDVNHVLSYFAQGNAASPESGSGMSGPFKALGVTFVDVDVFPGGYGARPFVSAYAPDTTVAELAAVLRARGYRFKSSTEPLGKRRNMTVMTSQRAAGDVASGEYIATVLIPARVSDRGRPAMPGGATLLCSYGTSADSAGQR